MLVDTSRCARVSLQRAGFVQTHGECKLNHALTPLIAALQRDYSPLRLVTVGELLSNVAKQASAEVNGWTNVIRYGDACAGVEGSEIRFD
jgi:hypothetical protein